MPRFHVPEAVYLITCAALTNGCRSAIAIDGPRNIDIYDLDYQVPEDRRVADLLAASGWRLNYGQWVCGNHDATPAQLDAGVEDSRINTGSVSEPGIDATDDV